MKFPKLKIPVVLWVILFATFVIFLALIPEHGDDNASTVLPDLKVYNQDRSHYANWERKEAVKFGFEQISMTINYLFVAAAALLAFIVKTLIDPIVEEKKVEHLTPANMTYLKHSAVGCVLSIFFGFYARLYFNNIGDRIGFSIYDEFGVGSLYQLVAFFLAIMFLMIAVHSITKRKITSSKIFVE